jgi:hypothetical protein
MKPPSAAAEIFASIRRFRREIAAASANNFPAPREIHS